jgi:hypothetical protein
MFMMSSQGAVNNKQSNKEQRTRAGILVVGRLASKAIGGNAPFRPADESLFERRQPHPTRFRAPMLC